MACKYCFSFNQKAVLNSSVSFPLPAASLQTKILEQLDLALTELQQPVRTEPFPETAALIGTTGKVGVKTLLLKLATDLETADDGDDRELVALLSLGEKECLPALLKLLNSSKISQQTLAFLTLQQILPQSEFSQTLADFLQQNQHLDLDFINIILENGYPDSINCQGLNLLLAQILQKMPEAKERDLFSGLGLIIEIANQKLYYLDYDLLQKTSACYKVNNYVADSVETCLALWELRGQVQNKLPFTISKIDQRNWGLFLEEQNITLEQLNDENLKTLFSSLNIFWTPRIIGYLTELKKDQPRLERLVKEVLAAPPPQYLIYTNYFTLLKTLPAAQALTLLQNETVYENRNAEADRVALLFWVSYFSYETQQTDAGKKYFEEGLPFIETGCPLPPQ